MKKFYLPKCSLLLWSASALLLALITTSSCESAKAPHQVTYDPGHPDGDADGFVQLPPPIANVTSESFLNAKMSANKSLGRIWFDEVISRRNLDAMDEHYAEDYLHHGAEGAEIRGIEAARDFAASILAASENRIAVVEQQVAEGDLVVTRFVSRGTHTGVFRGMQPAGKEWVTEGICISRIEDGKIAEDWEIVHVSGL